MFYRSKDVLPLTVLYHIFISACHFVYRYLYLYAPIPIYLPSYIKTNELTTTSDRYAMLFISCSYTSTVIILHNYYISLCIPHTARTQKKTNKLNDARKFNKSNNVRNRVPSE